MAERNMESFAVRLEDVSLDLMAKISAATELRDIMDTWTQSDLYGQFLERFIPIFMKLLDGRPTFSTTSLEHRLPSCILELIHRLPCNPPEIFAPYAAQIVDRCIELIRVEDEDNALLCIKITMDLVRHLNQALASRVQPFLDLIQEMFESMGQVVTDTFGSPSQDAAPSIAPILATTEYTQSPRPGSPAASSSDTVVEHQQARPLLKGMQSFKVLAECPIVVVSIFQAHRDMVSVNVKKFVPVIKGVLTLQAAPQEQAHADARARGKSFIGLSSELKNRAAFGEFITAQVKTMSFLAYILRVYGQQLQDFLPTLPDIVVRLLRDCPKEKCSTRKELLVAVRHIINFNVRKIFLKSIDALLDERTLLGDGLTVHETLRPLAYSLLADLIHHVRDSLTVDQIRLTIQVYTRNLRDSFPGTSFQTMSARLLMNMADCTVKLEDKQEARNFIMAILDAIGDKFAAMNRGYQNAVKLSSRLDQETPMSSFIDYSAAKESTPEWDEIDIFTASPIKITSPRDVVTDPVADNKFLFKNLVHGLKNLFYQLRLCNPAALVDPANAPRNWQEVACGFSAEEVRVLIKLFHEGAQVFRYYPSDQAPNDSQTSPVELLANLYVANKEEKEVLENFANVFHHVDPATFHEVFHSEIPHLYEMIFEHSALLHVPQFLLAGEATSSAFAGMLLQFLMDRIEEIGTADVNKATILLRLFKLAFMAVTLYAPQNEQILLPHVNRLVTQAIKLSTTAEAPMHYFYLLRSLFRSIGGGKFEHIYKEILPLLEMLLEVLNNLIMAARKTQEQDLYVELSLTVPARLSNLLPHLTYLMKPLVLALRAGSDLVAQGLRTLELCVDNLTPDYLDPIMGPVIDDLMSALWDHLKPSPYSHFHAHTTMRILGKLGGRNRRFLDGPPELSFDRFSDGVCHIDIRLVGSSNSLGFPAALGIDLAIAKLHETPRSSAAKAVDLFYKQRAFRLIVAQVKLVIGSDTLPDDFNHLVRLQADDLADNIYDNGKDLTVVTDREESVSKRDSQQKLLKDLLKACMFASSITELKDEARTFIKDLCKHITILEIGRALADAKQDRKPFNVGDGEGQLVIDPRVLIDAIVESLSSDKGEVRDAAEDAILAVRNAAGVIFGSASKANKLPCFKHFVAICCHGCYEEEWFTKAGGILGINILATKLDLGDDWLAERQPELCRALLYAVKDLPEDLPATTRSKALETLSIVIRSCNKTTSKEDLLNKSSKLITLCQFLVYELAHTSRHVRDAAQSILAVLAEMIGAETYELVAPVKMPLLTHIFFKPLRALPFSIQIGYMEAIAFCLKLQNGILESNEQLTRFLRETVLLADQDDEVLTTKLPDQRNSESLIRLRVSIHRLLSVALEVLDLNSSSPPNRARPKIISTFFKSLYNPSPEVYGAANEALRVVVEKDTKLPKDILQTGLRPILVSLQDSSKLKVDNLDCLARLLQLLKNYFKVEIGTRLLDNIRPEADAVLLQKASFTLLEQHDKILTLAAILNVFHLLPPAANTFMETLVTKVLELEQKLRRTNFSPFREPIIKYLNRYPQEAWERLFSIQLSDQATGRFLAQILADKASTPLREAVIRNLQGFIDIFSSDGDGTDHWVTIINAIHIADSMCAYPEVRKSLLSHETLRKALLLSGTALQERLQENGIPANLRLAADQAGDRLMHILTFYISQEPSDLDFLFKIIAGVTSQRLKNSPSLLQVIYHDIISSKSHEQLRRVVLRCVDVYTDNESVEPLRAFVIRYLINPILAKDVMRNWDRVDETAGGTQLVNKSLMEDFQIRLWQPQSNIDTTDDNLPVGIDHSRMELLQMTTILLKYYSSVVQDVRKNVIRFGWTYLRLEDIISKHGSYVLLAYFIAHFDTPTKIACQIYMFLVKACIPEARSIVLQALEVLAPVLQKRMPNTEPLAPSPWVKYAQNPMLEDPSNLQQTISIYQFVSRHADLFYEAKEFLAQSIISNIHKVAQPPQASLESKKLALNLVSLIWTWEQMYRSDTSSTETANATTSPKSRKRNVDGTPVISEKARYPDVRSFILAPASRYMLIKWLVNFIAGTQDRYPLPSAKIKDANNLFSAPSAQSTAMCKRALTLFQGFLSAPFWIDLDIDAMFPKVTEFILTSDPKQDDKFEMSVTRIVNTLQLLKVMVDVKPDDWIISRLPQLQRLLEKPVRNSHPEIQDCLYRVDENLICGTRRIPLIVRIVGALPAQTSEDDEDSAQVLSSEFVSFLSAVAAEALSAGNHVVGINILSTFATCRPQEIDQHIALIMKSMSQLLKDHLTAHNVVPGQASLTLSTRPGEPIQVPPPDANAIELQTEMILKVIDMLAVRMLELGDHRRPYLQVLTTLVEKSPSFAICSRMLQLVSSWIFDSDQMFPTLKEKTAVVLKMISFEHRPDPALFHGFLEIIIRIYEDSKITRSELAVRLEPAFLVGTRASNVEMRTRFMSLFDRHLSRTASKRLLYVLAAQNWEHLADTFWLSQVMQLLFGSIEYGAPTRLSVGAFKIPAASKFLECYKDDPRRGNLLLDEDFESLMLGHRRFCSYLADVRTRELLEPLCQLQHTDSYVASRIWVSLFPLFWSALVREERTELQTGMLALMTKDFHARQIDKRPNCIQTLLEGITRTENPRMNFPHHLVKYLARTYDAWYPAMIFMEQNVVEPTINTAAVRESNLDALAEMYASLQEDDMFYGLWRRRCQFLETNTALSYEQHGAWDKAQRMFESATFKARTGAAPFSESEYMLWEDHWVICAQKLQQWDVLSDFAKNDNLNDLYLDSVWRHLEYWNSPEHRKQLDGIIKGVSDAPTPRRAFFQSFMSLLKLHSDNESPQNFNRICDEAIQLSIRKWHQLPRRITNAHVPILQNFQQLVELHDASVICASLATTNQTNLDQKSPELKLLLGTWRDRLPNFWDDINAWQDLVTWRQHIFQLINQKYLSLIPPQQSSATGSSFAYRGYHETASIINRFAHVARKHQLPEVCISQLSKIYTLPNIEIREAFMKLREQAKCHYQNPSELQTGLDVINNTNLNYFGQQQKAEFYTLKGMFLAKQKHTDEANDAFGSALFFDLKLPKAWAEWARYNDQMFKEDPTDITKAKHALSCYLEAAATYKNSKSRKLLSRVLWLLSLDDQEETLASCFEDFKGEPPVWYWITFIPQLLTSLSRQEARISRMILQKLAKQYPQALYFQLRTSREDMQAIRKQQEAKDKDKATQMKQGSPIPKQGSPVSRPNTSDSHTDSITRPGTANEETAADSAADGTITGAPPTPKIEPSEQGWANATVKQEEPRPAAPRKPWEYTEEIVSVLKTAFPLLALSMETMVDQMARNFKCPPDEDAYRLIVALLNDALGYVCRSPRSYDPGSALPASTQSNITRFAESILPPHIRTAFEKDFVTDKPDLRGYIDKLRNWRDKFEDKLDRRNPHANLENYGPHLVEFKFQKFDDVEVPGQYLLHKDGNKDFIRIERFLPDIDLTRGSGICHRRLRIRGHDGSVHPFAIQHPAARTCRREEKIVQMFRFFNDVLGKRQESRRRKLNFALPVMVPLTPVMRMVQDDPSYISLQGIYEDHCRKTRMSKDDPILFTVTKLREIPHMQPPDQPDQSRVRDHATQIRLQTFEAIQANMVPNTVVLDYFQATYPSYSDFWLFRRQFSYQLASLTFLTYIMHMRDRHPSRMSISRGTGNVWGSELVPSMPQNKAVFSNGEPVQVRLTPNLQMLMGPVALEGIFSAAVLVIAKCLTEPDFKLEQQLSIFIRDEVNYHYLQNHRTNVTTAQFREAVQVNSDLVVKRAIALAKAPPGNLPANQSVIDVVSAAVNPVKLSASDPLWMACL